MGRHLCLRRCVRGAGGEGQRQRHRGSKCADNDGFEGVVLSVARDGKACSVAMGGMVTVSYTGASAPAAGWNSLAADGSGGVKVVSDGGKGYLAVEVDTTAKTVTIVL